MTDNIFKSKFTLAFSNPIIETTFLQNQVKNINRFTLTFTLLNLIFSLTSSILVMISKKDFTDENMQNCYRIFFPISTLILCLYLAISVPTIFIKNSKFQRIINYCNYSFISLSFGIMRGSVIILWKSDISFYCIVQFFDFFFKMIWTLCCTLGFLETSLLSIINVILTASLMSSVDPWWKVHPYAAILSFVVFCAIIFTTYFYFKELKRSFYFSSEINFKKQWYENIIDNMNTGFMCINASDNQILFLNKSIIEHIMSNQKLMTSIQAGNWTNNEPTSLSINEDQVNYDALLTKIKQNSHMILKNLFADFVINSVPHNQANTRKNSGKTEWANLNANNETTVDDSTSLELWFKSLKEICDKFHANKKFVYVGRGSFNSRRDSSSMNMNMNSAQTSSLFEIYCRYNKKSGTEEENYDLIFNDVTRTRIIEAKNAGNRYKSLYLEKIAHDVKNPIIAISELVEQAGNAQAGDSESINQSFAGDTTLFHTLSSGHLTMIKSLADYLLILIKNLHYFSKVLNTEEQGNLTIGECNIDELLNFNQRIAKALLRANDKDKDIKLFITKDINIPVNIHTDEIMLKQILISLLTNAIKFTNKGQIIISAENEGEYTKFSVTDTGIGISPIQEEYLFKHLSKIEDDWLPTGGEFGLKLVKDMTSKLGKSLEYSTEIGKGTTFWFYVKSHEAGFTILPKWMIQEHKINPADIPASDSHSSIETKKIENNIMLFPKQFREKITAHVQEDIPPSEKECTSPPQVAEKPLNVVIVDDEAFTRQATIRILKKIAQDKNVNINIIEAQDGIETIYLAYKYLIKGEGLNCIISDENMPFWSGRKSAEILNEFECRKNIRHVPFFLVSAYEECKEKNNVNIDGFFSKPLLKSGAESILCKVKGKDC